MRMRWTAILAAGVVSALLLVGCGGGSTGALGLAASDEGAPDVAASAEAGEAQLDDALPEVDAQPVPVQDDWAQYRGATWQEAMAKRHIDWGWRLGGCSIMAMGLCNGANLSGLNLEGATLSMAALDTANLSHSYLRKAYLASAGLANANLSKAFLEFAKLPKADLKNADLTGADLEGANLSETNLMGADLEGANLHAANFSLATWFNGRKCLTRSVGFCRQ